MKKRNWKKMKKWKLLNEIKRNENETRTNKRLSNSKEKFSSNENLLNEKLLNEKIRNETLRNERLSNERLFLALGTIDEEVILNAAPVFQKNNFHPIWKRIPSQISAAVCILMLFFLFMIFKYFNPFYTKRISKELPFLIISNNSGMGAGGGSCGFLVHDYSELIDANPWSEKEKITTLPVFKNLDFPVFCQDTEEWIEPEKTMDKKHFFHQLHNKIGEIVWRLVENPNQLPITITETIEDDSIIINGDGFRIYAPDLYRIDLEFIPTIALPKEYANEYTSYEELEKVAEYFKTEYQKWMDMPSATVNICDRYYGYDGSPLPYTMAFFNAEGSIEEQILNYNFHTVKFIRDSDGNLWIIRWEEIDLSGKIGDYPIISAEEAKKLLLNGSFINNSSDEFPQKDSILETKLIYLTVQTSEYFMPYYRFAVALHEELPNYVEDRTLHSFDYYYVPAIEAKYITNMPLWDGVINR